MDFGFAVSCSPAPAQDFVEVSLYDLYLFSQPACKLQLVGRTDDARHQHLAHAAHAGNSLPQLLDRGLSRFDITEPLFQAPKLHLSSDEWIARNTAVALAAKRAVRTENRIFNCGTPHRTPYWLLSCLPRCSRRLF